MPRRLRGRKHQSASDLLSFRAAEPKIERLQVDGRGFHTSTYAVRGTYSGGREGKSVIQWFRASGVKQSEDLTPIPGATLKFLGRCCWTRWLWLFLPTQLVFDNLEPETQKPCACIRASLHSAVRLAHRPTSVIFESLCLRIRVPSTQTIEVRQTVEVDVFRRASATRPLRSPA